VKEKAKDQTVIKAFFQEYLEMNALAPFKVRKK
jgi:hypothetical protein